MPKGAKISKFERFGNPAGDHPVQLCQLSGPEQTKSKICYLFHGAHPFHVKGELGVGLSESNRM